MLARVRANRVLVRYVVDGRWRRTVVIAAATLAVPLLFDRVVAPFMHDRRQDALVAQFTSAPKSSTLRFGDAVAVLQIPSIGVNSIVAEGETHATLRAGPTHRSSSPLPGSVGNAVISAKSFRYGAEFSRLRELQPGAEIFVQLRGTEPVRFVVDDVSTGGELDAVGQGASLTLVTSSTRLGGAQVVAHATAAEGAPLIESPLPASAVEDRVSFADFGVVATWIAAAVALGALARRAPAPLRNVGGLAVFVPVVVLVALQLMLALERLAPATV